MDLESGDALVIIQHSIFEKNIGYFYEVAAGGGSVVSVKGDLTTKLMTKNCLFFDSGLSSRGSFILSFYSFLHIQGTIILFTVTYTDHNSTFIGNRKVIGGGAFYFCQYTKAYLYSTKFYDNHASVVAGTIALTPQSFAMIENATFVASSAELGGVFKVSEGSGIANQRLNL